MRKPAGVRFDVGCLSGVYEDLNKGETYTFIMTKSDYVIGDCVCIEGGFTPKQGKDVRVHCWDVDDFNDRFKRISQGAIIYAN